MIDFAVEDLFPLFDEFSRAAGISQTALSSRLYRESKKIALLRAGGQLTLERFNHTVKYLDANWPVEAVWCGRIPRPSIAVAA